MPKGLAISRRTGLDLGRLSPLDLLRLGAASLDELKARGIVRSANAALGDYAELLVCRALKLRREAKSNRGFDATDDEGHTYEIKARRLTGPRTSRQVGALRNLEKRPFMTLVGVLFRADFSILAACLVPVDTVISRSRFYRRTSSWTFYLPASLWEVEGVVDVTGVLTAAATELERDPAVRSADGHRVPQTLRERSS